MAHGEGFTWRRRNWPRHCGAYVEVEEVLHRRTRPDSKSGELLLRCPVCGHVGGWEAFAPTWVNGYLREMRRRQRGGGV